MEEILYLEADEEITSVVDKLKGLEAKSVGLVAPKGSTIAQSLVSLKLLKKEAEKQGKTISLVTSDEVGQNLANQVGLVVYRDVKSSRPISVPELDEPGDEPIKIDMAKAGAAAAAAEAAFAVHRYDEEEAAAAAAADEAAAAEEKVEEKPVEESEVPKETFVKRPVGEEFTAKGGEREEIESAQPVHDKVQKTAKGGLSKKKLWLLIGGGIVLFILLILAADFLFAKMTVKLAVQADQIEKEADITVEKDRPQIDYANAVIPGVKISKEKSFEDTFNATGEKDVGQKAKGTITFKNEAGTDESISAGTKVTSSGGLEFTLDGSITVPKATLNPSGDKVLGSATGTITAKENGSKYNLASSTSYIVAGKSKISANGATSGGVTKTVKVVTKTDLDKAKNQLKSQDAAKFLEPADQAKGEVYLDGASNIELLDFTSSKNAGDEADSFTGKAKLKFEVISFKNDDFRLAVTKAVEKTIPPDKGLLIESSDTITPTLKENNLNLGKLVVTGKLKTHLGPKIAIDELKRSWRLKSLKKVRQSLNLPGLTIEDIGMTPSFSLPFAPARQSNIKIELEYNPSGNPGT